MTGSTTRLPALAIAAGLLLQAPAMLAQTPAAKFVDSARVAIDRAVRDMDPAGLDSISTFLDRALVAFPDDPYLLHYRGYARYWQVAGLFMGGHKDAAPPLIQQGLTDLKKSAEKLAWPETIQLEACLNSYLIAIDPGNGPTLGPLTGRLSGEATKMAPNNPRVLLLQAIIAERTPPSMGGGTARARELAEKSLAAFADDHPGPLAPSWGRGEADALVKRLSSTAGRTPNG